MFNLDVLGYECPLRINHNIITVRCDYDGVEYPDALEHLIHSVLVAARWNSSAAHEGLRIYCQSDLFPAKFEHHIPYYPTETFSKSADVLTSIKACAFGIKHLVITDKAEVLDTLASVRDIFFIYIGIDRDTDIRFRVWREDNGDYKAKVYSDELLYRLYSFWPDHLEKNTFLGKPL